METNSFGEVRGLANTCLRLSIVLAIVSMKFVEHMNVYDILFINDQYVQ